jgi:hypothetical protein
MIATKQHRWASPLEWLEEAAQQWDPARLYQELIALATGIDSDTLHDEYRTEMEIDGYFEDLRWTDEDAEAAGEEGWGIFETSRGVNEDGTTPSDSVESEIVDGHVYGHRPYELQKIDEDDTLHDEMAAWHYVIDTLTPLHLRVLAYLREVSPHEYNALIRFGIDSA